MEYTLEELRNLLVFLNRVDLKGQEAFVWSGLYAKINQHMNMLEGKAPMQGQSNGTQLDEKEEMKLDEDGKLNIL